jgi:UDP-N-acetylmuramoyl-L-alanyl-D-glutamate--2,6-diaminopimelate ligase
MYNTQVSIAELIYKAKRPYHFVKTGLMRGFRAERQLNFPARKLKILTITGTDGKTTSTTMLYHVLKTAGKKVALLSTVAAYINNETIDTGLHVTSPDPAQLHTLLAKMVEKNIEYVVLEVTSHGMYQYRVWGINPLIAGITNINHEHLDYHITYKNYLEAKAMLLAKAKTAILNDDDQSAPMLKRYLRSVGQKFSTYSTSDKIYYKVKQAIDDTFTENYNKMNARLVYAMCQNLGIQNQDFISAIKTFPGVPGRMEEIAKKPFRVIVDFAHTPQALEAALSTLKKQLPTKKSKLIAIYGCAGLRDNSKRPIMGRIGAELADLVVFTAEDPRTEDVWSIIRQMKEQLTSHHNKITSIADRGEAIRFALSQLAQKDDIVVILGKGHEQSMCYGTTEYPWDDRVFAKEVLTSLKKKPASSTPLQKTRKQKPSTITKNKKK